MKTIEKVADLTDQLAQFPAFADINRSALTWLVDQADYLEFEVGDAVFTPGEPTIYMYLVTEGAYRVELVLQGETRDIGTFEAPVITGLLPFSRMKESKAHAKVLTKARVLRVHRDRFVEMVNVSYELVQVLVAQMSDRIRDFTANRLQNEKLMSLGKLSAGLAHELNNPASAIVRGVEELRKVLHKSPEQFKEVITMEISTKETDEINKIIFSKLEKLGDFDDLSLMDQENRKDDLLDWLEDHDVENAEDLSETFAEFSLLDDDLDSIHETLSNPEALSIVLQWANQVLTMEKISSEVQEASSRIADLVGTIKEYSHMDRSKSAQIMNLHDGLKSTIVLLKHKLKQKQIELRKELDYDLPNVELFPGEINQVWTNIIDNAIDAMDKGGQLGIRSYQQHNRVFVEISDTGHGIPEEVLSKIFDPFFTTKGVGEGTGLGLEVTRRIIDRHRGTIKVDSVPGQTTFTICLPLKQS